jgi:uroporphyrin-III C-methyltransferase
MRLEVEGILDCGVDLMVAAALAPDMRGWLVAAGSSAEPGDAAALHALGQRPLLDVGTRLGGGADALLALPMLEAAARRDGDVRRGRGLGRCGVNDLNSPEVLALARRDARLVEVGHRAGREHRHPAGVAAEMARAARAGDVVCRLKGGDSHVLGRGGEEVEALAGPGAAGSPRCVTGLARSFLVVTGHDELDWRRLGAGTAVVLMGLRRLGEITAAMVDAGWSAETPAAVVSRATTPRQRQVYGQLGTIAGRVVEEAIEAPALLVVGEVLTVAGGR